MIEALARVMHRYPLLKAEAMELPHHGSWRDIAVAFVEHAALRAPVPADVRPAAARRAEVTAERLRRRAAGGIARDSTSHCRDPALHLRLRVRAQVQAIHSCARALDAVIAPCRVGVVAVHHLAAQGGW